MRILDEALLQTVHTVGDYGCALWGPVGDMGSANARRNVKAIQEVQDRAARVVLGAQRRQAHETPRAILGQEPAALRIEREIVRTWGSIRMLDRERHPVAKILYIMLTEATRGNGGARRPALADKMYVAVENMLGWKQHGATHRDRGARQCHKGQVQGSYEKGI